MARQQGSANFAGTIEVQAGGPLDARAVVGTIADLTASSTFSYFYEGMQVYCKEDKKTYQLVGNDTTIEANWKASGADIAIDDTPTSGSNNAVSSGGVYTALNGKVNTSSIGTSGGVAELDENGKVPAAQLPSYVDDVIEGYYKASDDRFYEESTYETLIPPESGKAWVDKATNKSYRWTGSGYVRVDEGVQLGETSDTAYRGDRGKAAYDNIAMSYRTDDTAFTALADADYIPVYDTSATAKKKSLWSNIKAVLKTYFDTLYSTTRTSETAASGGTTLSLTTTGEKYNNQTNIPWYGTSSTSASTTAKTASLSRGTFTLIAGAKVSVKFTYTNTASTPTLNVGSTGAKSIKVVSANGTISTPESWWGAGDIVTFIYDGTQYIMQPTFSSVKVTEGLISNDYSTTEKIVGTWIDGTKLYQKTIDCGPLPNNTSKDVAHGISNFKRLIHIWGHKYRSSDGTNHDLPHPTSMGTSTVSVSVSSTNITINTASDQTAFTEAYLTLQYTKTTG